MLRDLTKNEWLSILDISESMVPTVLVIRGTRNLKTQYGTYRRMLTDVVDIGSPNGLLEDILIGTHNGVRVAYASVYGAPMASEVTHLFGVLGTSLVIQIGCCGAIGDGIEAGDLFIAKDAYCGEGASQYYKSDGPIVKASISTSMLPLPATDQFRWHTGSIYSTAALFAEGRREIDDWYSRGFGAVDMETAATFAVAEHFGMDRVSIVFTFDNPRQGSHMGLEEADKVRRRTEGNRRMNEIAFDIIQGYEAQTRQTTVE